jgi:glutathione S-transferase
MLELFTARNSICTQKVLITLAEKRLDYQVRVIDLFNNEQYRPEYLAINPKGVVPALRHDGRIVTESTLICEYLDDCFPEHRLIPLDPYLRTRMRKWSKAVDEGLFEATRELSFSAMFRERMRSMTEEQRQGRFRNVGDPTKRARFISTYEHGVESPFVLEGIAAFETAFKSMERELAEAQHASGAGGDASTWLLGTDLSLADINMMPFVARLAYLGLLDVWIGERARVQAWWRKVQGLDSFRSAVPGQLTAGEIEAMATFGGKIAQRVRERRQEYLELMGIAPAAA